MKSGADTAADGSTQSVAGSDMKSGAETAADDSTQSVAGSVAEKAVEYVQQLWRTDRYPLRKRT